VLQEKARQPKPWRLQLGHEEARMNHLMDHSQEQTRERENAYLSADGKVTKGVQFARP